MWIASRTFTGASVGMAGVSGWKRVDGISYAFPHTRQVRIRVPMAHPEVFTFKACPFHASGRRFLAIGLGESIVPESQTYVGGCWPILT